jgi:hypothetical protein
MIPHVGKEIVSPSRLNVKRSSGNDLVARYVYMDTLEKGFFLYQRAAVASLDAGAHPLVSMKQSAT